MQHELRRNPLKPSMAEKAPAHFPARFVQVPGMQRYAQDAARSPQQLQAAHKREKQVKESMTAQLKRELGWA